MWPQSIDLTWSAKMRHQIGEGTLLRRTRAGNIPAAATAKAPHEEDASCFAVAPECVAAGRVVPCSTYNDCAVPPNLEVIRSARRWTKDARGVQMRIRVASMMHHHVRLAGS